MNQKQTPSFNKEWANKVSKADFVDHFKDVYKTLSADELGTEWESMQEKKEVKAAKSEQPKAEK